ARDRFFMELSVEAPQARDQQRDLMFDTRFHDTDALIDTLEQGLVRYDQLNAVAAAVQAGVRAEPSLQDYAVDLWRALRDPVAAGIVLDGVEVGRLVAGGASPRGMAMMMRAARTRAWLQGRDY